MKKLFILLVLACSCSPAVQRLSDSMAGVRDYVPRYAVMAHRGSTYWAPEETESAWRWAREMGADYLESDLQCTKDGVILANHDVNLTRTTDIAAVFGEGLPRSREDFYKSLGFSESDAKEQCSRDLETFQPYQASSYYYAELLTLDAGSWFGPAWKGQKLPRFADLLEKARPTHLGITVDYRTGDFQALVDLIDSYGMLERTYFTFSSDEDTRRFRAMFPNIHTLQAYVRNPRELDKVLDEIHPDIAVLWIDQIDRQVVKRCHERGVKVLALILGLDDKTKANRKAIRLGVDVIATDKPELLVK